MSGNKSNGSLKNALNQNVDHVFKIFIIGNSSVGKTSLLFRYTDGTFTQIFASTLGLDFKVKKLVRNDKRIKLQIWDTAGQERHRAGTTIYYRGTMGFILMYDITNKDTFNSIRDWVEQIEKHAYGTPAVILVGNKCEMENERVVSVDDGEKLAAQFGLEFLETSVKDNINVKYVFEKMTDMILETFSSAPEEPSVTRKGIPETSVKPGAYVRHTIKLTTDDNDEEAKKKKRKRCEC